MKKIINDETTSKVGINIKLERVRHSISQEKLAELAGLSRATMGSIERGEKSPTVVTLAAIAKALDIELYKLFIFE